ncbi:TonB-dependent receptor [Sphingobacterium paludis]|uniref:Iron complex outermembrane receptor protein n=1 Tax=Sphingobacterium paludis TaxID=1476465 RepID=A0A4R7D9N7_9SPHI|nr:TonB-dependent receptor [Sphingobacterium paludis]TDS17477.1 iron complex outermembrane receptor protein [Sphingobacterium paludis]
MQKTWIGLLLLPLFLWLSANAQEGCAIRIQGTVKSNLGKPLADVSIRLDKNRAATTDGVGQFLFSKICAGNYRFAVTHLGYHGQEVSLSITKDTTLVFELLADAIHLQDVEIIGQQQGSLSSSVHRLTAQELQESRGKTLAESLTAISGVSTVGMGNSIVKPVINGLHSNRILIMNNGIRQEGQQWGVEHAPEVDPFLADRLEVVKGAQGVRYGADALGGVVLVKPKAIDTSKPFGGEIDLQGRSNGRGGVVNASLEGAIKKMPALGWRLQASAKKLGDYETPHYVVGNTGVEELNYSAAVDYKRDKNTFELFYSHFGTTLGIFTGAHIGTVADIEARIQNGRPFETYDFTYNIGAPRQKVSHDLAKASWKHRFDADRSIDVQYGYQRNHRREYDVRRVEADDLPMADMVLSTQSLDVVLKDGNSSIGIQSLVQINNNTPGTGTTPIIPNFDSYNLGVFGIHQFHIGRLHAEAGARYDFKYLDVAGYRYRRDAVNEDGSVEQYLLTDTRKFHNASGTVGVLYHFSPQWSLKSNIGLAWRAPSANELYSDGVHHGSATYELGNQNLRSEKGLKWMSSLIRSSSRMQFTADVYAQLLYDYIYAQPNPDSVRQTIRGTFPLFVYEQHDALFYGVDLRFSYQFAKDLHYDVNASLLRARNISRDTYLPYIPADRVQHGISWNLFGESQPHSYLKVAHRFVAQQHRYEPNSDYAAPPPAYHLVDFVAAKQFQLNTAHQLNLLLAVDNVFNTEYKDYMDRLRYFTHQMGRNVSLKISYHF